MRTKLGKNVNPKNLLQNTRQEFPCQSLKSFSGEYYNMGNKILDVQFEPVCAKQTHPKYSVGSDQDEAEIHMTDGVHKNGATEKCEKMPTS